MRTCCRYEASAGHESLVLWETDLGKIRRRYLCSWFAPDLLSIAPSSFDLLLVAQAHEEGSQPAGGVHTTGTSGVKVMRIIRALRLVKLIRLVRSSRSLRRVLKQVNLPLKMLHLGLMLFGVVCMAHLFACTLGMIGNVFADNPLDTWLATHGLCWPTQQHEVKVGNITRPFECADAWVLYLQSFYLALGTIIAYTDEAKTGPQESHFSDPASVSLWRPGEQVACVLLLFSGAVVWSYITGHFVDMISNGNPETVQFNHKLDVLNHMCSHHRIDGEKRQWLRDYLHESRDTLRVAADCAEAYEMLSPALYREVRRIAHSASGTAPVFVTGTHVLLCTLCGHAASPGKLIYFRRTHS